MGETDICPLAQCATANLIAAIHRSEAKLGNLPRLERCCQTVSNGGEEYLMAGCVCVDSRIGGGMPKGKLESIES